jgi:Flp pilus assembly protein TadG
MTQLAGIYRRFVASTRGIAAVEFAFVAPIVLVLLLATFDAARAIAVYMKVRAATYTLDAITNQYPTISDAIKDQIFKAVAAVLSPYPSTSATAVISGISIDANKRATVTWSDPFQGAQALAIGSPVTIPDDLKQKLLPNTMLILGTVSYRFTPLLGYFANGGITFSDNLFVSPRSAAVIQRTP